MNLPRTLVLFRKLVLFTVPVFFVLSAAGLYVISSERLLDARDAFSTRIGNSVGRTATSIERLLNNSNFDASMKDGAAQQLLLLLLGDQAIKCATLTRTGETEPAIVAPVGLGCQFGDVDEWLEISLAVDGWQELRVGFSKAELAEMRASQLQYALTVLLGALAISLISSWIAFRVIVGKPLNALIRDLVVARDAADAASKAKTRFLANMSHEIRTPMNGIIGTAELLSETDLSQQQRDSVRTIVNSGNALMLIIEDILDFAKIEAERVELNEEEFKLGDVIYEASDLVEPSATGKGLNLIIDHAGEERHAFIGDDIRLRQVLLNLMGNAVKFCEEGTVTLSVNVEAHDGWSDITFRVIDTGIGIPNDKLTAIFQPFGQASQSTTRNFGGTGLGLTISSELVSLMGGELTAASELGRGSEFRFTLALRHGRSIEASPAVHALTELARQRSLRVLAVDDVDLNLQVVAQRLTVWGIACDMTEYSEVALELLSRARVDGHPYDAAIVDYDMPDVTGAELAELIREDPAIAETPLILLSSVNVVTRMRRSPDSAFDASLTKPLRPKQLAQALCTVLGERTRASEEDAHARAGEVIDGVFARVDILVADDSEINRDLLAQQLAPTGARLRFARNGALAVESATGRRPDVILMDLSMPVMGGFEATREIRAMELRDARAPSLIFALSANVLQEHKDAAIAAGMDGFIPKPTRRRDLIAAIEALYDPREREAAAHDAPGRPTAVHGADVTPRAAESAADLVVEEDIAELRDMIGGAKLAQLATTLEQQGDEILGEIETALAAGNDADAAAAAHKLAGGAASLGCRAISEAMQVLEHDIRAGALPDAARIAALADLWRDTKAALPSSAQTAAAE